MKALTLVLFVTLVTTLVAVAPARTLEIEEVAFADRFSRAPHDLAIRGAALLRYRVLFRGYVGALYLPEDIPSTRVFDDVPKRLELSYFWGIEGKFFGEAGDEVLEKNVDAATLAALRERLDRLNEAYRDVEPGDRYALTYLPGIGTELALNDEPIVVIPGADFGAAYFQIWLGRDPIDDGFRDALLGGRAR